MISGKFTFFSLHFLCDKNRHPAIMSSSHDLAQKQFVFVNSCADNMNFMQICFYFHMSEDLENKLKRILKTKLCFPSR